MMLGLEPSPYERRCGYKQQIGSFRICQTLTKLSKNPVSTAVAAGCDRQKSAIEAITGWLSLNSQSTTQIEVSGDLELVSLPI